MAVTANIHTGINSPEFPNQSNSQFRGLFILKNTWIFSKVNTGSGECLLSYFWGYSMFLLSRLAGGVDSKDSRMKGLFISRTKLCFWRQKEKWSTLYHVKANKNFAKNKSKTKKFPLLIVVNKSSYGKLC